MSLKHMLMTEAAAVGTDTDSLSREYTVTVVMAGQERACRI